MSHILSMSKRDHEYSRYALGEYARLFPWLGLVAAVKEQSKQISTGEMK